MIMNRKRLLVILLIFLLIPVFALEKDNSSNVSLPLIRTA